MKMYLLVLCFFLLAFIGLGIGLLLRGRRLRGGCGHDPNTKGDCACADDGQQKPQEECRRHGRD